MKEDEAGNAVKDMCRMTNNTLNSFQDLRWPMLGAGPDFLLVLRGWLMSSPANYANQHSHKKVEYIEGLNALNAGKENKRTCETHLCRRRHCWVNVDHRRLGLLWFWRFDGWDLKASKRKNRKGFVRKRATDGKAPKEILANCSFPFGDALWRMGKGKHHEGKRERGRR